MRRIADIGEGRLGISTVHALRHTFAHGREEVGATVSAMQARRGHSRLATTGRFLQALKGARTPQVDALAERFGLAMYARQAAADELGAWTLPLIYAEVWVR